MKFLVTGAAGFIGFHVSQELLARGDEVIGLDNLNDYYDPARKRSNLRRFSRKRLVTVVSHLWRVTFVTAVSSARFLTDITLT